MLCAAFTIGCGASSSPPAPLSPAPLSPPPSAAPRADGEIAPSPLLARSWPFEEPASAIFLDARRAFDSPLARTVIAHGEGQVGAATRAQGECIDAFSAHAREVAIGSDERGQLILVDIGPPGPWLEACATAFGHKALDLNGATHAWASAGDITAVTSSGLLVHGRRDLVERALAASESPRPSITQLRLREGEALTARVNFGAPWHVVVSTTAERFEVHGEAVFETEERAALFETAFGHVVRALEVTRDGRRVSARFELKEPPLLQLRDLAAAATALRPRMQSVGCQIEPQRCPSDDDWGDYDYYQRR